MKYWYDFGFISLCLYPLLSEKLSKVAEWHAPKSYSESPRFESRMVTDYSYRWL